MVSQNELAMLKLDYNVFSRHEFLINDQFITSRASDAKIPDGTLQKYRPTVIVQNQSFRRWLLPSAFEKYFSMDGVRIDTDSTATVRTWL